MDQPTFTVDGVDLDELDAASLVPHLQAAARELAPEQRGLCEELAHELTPALQAAHEQAMSAAHDRMASVGLLVVPALAVQLMALRDAAQMVAIMAAKALGLTLDQFLAMAMDDFQAATGAGVEPDKPTLN